MAGTKRSAEGSSPRTTRSSKIAKKDGDSSPKHTAKGGKKGPKSGVAASSFLKHTLPFTAHLTHTPPSIPDGETVSAASADPGNIGSVKCLTTQFATGSYGWKGNKRVKMEITNEAGEKEEVQVQITINATVIGSKNAPGDDADEEEKAEEAEP